MEYVGLRIVHPTKLIMQLPSEVAELLRLIPAERGAPGGQAISFVARGAGIARVLSTARMKEALAVEAVEDRFLTTAAMSKTLGFSVPAGLLKHLEIEYFALGPKQGRATEDRLLWFMPAHEYYAWQAESRGQEWAGPQPGGEAHIYVTKSELPLPKSTSGLAALERRIEYEEWATKVPALRRAARLEPRAPGSGPRRDNEISPEP